MSTQGQTRPAILVDSATHTFKVNRRNFVDPDIFEAEKEQIFDRCWLYLGPRLGDWRRPGDFVTRTVARARTSSSIARQRRAHCMRCSTPARTAGAQVCRESKGNSKSFQCFYHGWVFGQDGALRSQPGEASYPVDFKSRDTWARPDAGATLRRPSRASASCASIPMHQSVDRLPGRRQGRAWNVICEPERRRHGGRGRRAGVRDPRQLEAAGREQRRRLPRGHHARELPGLPEVGHRRLRGAHRATRGRRFGTRATATRCWSTRRPGAGPSRRWVPMFGEAGQDRDGPRCTTSSTRG
jgi:hypothetical protein